MTKKSHFDVLIIGAGTGGIMTAAGLIKRDRHLKIGMLDPSEKHFYQPAWTLVGAGTYSLKKTERDRSGLIPKGVHWIKDAASSFDPENNLVSTQSHGDLHYKVMIVATGLVMEPSLIEGLEEALGKDGVCSNYVDPEYTWQVLQNFKGGNAVFTQPTTPIKCGGAPQKIAYLAADYFRLHNLDKKTRVIFATPGSVIFGVKEIKETLMKVIKRYKIHFRPLYAPVKIDAAKKEIYFKPISAGENQCVINADPSLKEERVHDELIKIPYDMLHIAPPQAAPKVIRESKLANSAGWLDVDLNSLQHKTYKNVFGLGDVAALPTAKTGAAIRKQAPVVINNVIEYLKSQTASNHDYQGYSSCPLVTGYGKMVLAEFDYQNNFTPDPKLKQMGVFDSSKESWRLWLLKKYMLPYLYWTKMLKGKEV